MVLEGVRKAMRLGKYKYSFIFLAPALFFILILYFMTIWTIAMSFTDWTFGSKEAHFAGLDRYLELSAEERFWRNVYNNILWLVFFVIPSTLLGFFLAFLMEISAEKLEPYLRPLFLYPTALSFVVTGVLWSWIFDPRRGVFNFVLANYLLEVPVLREVLQVMGITKNSLPLLLDDPDRAIFCIVMAAMWQYTGFAMLLFLAAFRESLLRQLIEAAMIDGAGALQLLKHIILPNMKHAFLIVTCLLAIFSLKVFDVVWVMTRGGPGYATEVLAVYMYVAAFAQDLLAKGCAIATIIFSLTAVIIVPYVYYAIKRWFGL
ncbi:MAG: hypothetical protein DRN15_01765 [Thermoprotei archaeon]|nr:MAG: hypothetical protein DRM97_03455 [Thermoprotei archaeon]RLF24691.1 MAG: hypothetical protein DRN15_01765 [Thermoprotei archaeon]